MCLTLKRKSDDGRWIKKRSTSINADCQTYRRAMSIARYKNDNRRKRDNGIEQSTLNRHADNRNINRF
jgi:hypothetical protein